MCDNLGTGFTVGIRIKAIERLILAVAPLPFFILIDLIGRDIQETLYARILSDALTDIDGSHDIGLVGIDRILVRIPHDRLCREMKHDLRLRLFKDLL